MKKYFLKPISLKLIVSFVLILVVLIIHSCRKDNKSDSKSSPEITQARVWYENTYPVSNSANGKLIAQSNGGSRDLSQLIKPDWQHSTSYVAGNKNVIEMPVDPASKFSSIVKFGKTALNKAYSRSYYLLINDGKKYDAYILTIIADSAYVNNDLSKLAHNTYRKQDVDFSGLALYYTPKGDYLGGFAYKNGQVVTPATAQQTSGQKIQSVNNGNLKPNNMEVNCQDWYQQVTVTYTDGSSTTGEWTYLGTTCTFTYTDESGGGVGGTGVTGTTVGQGGSGSSSPTPPPPCPLGSTSGVPTTSPCVMPPSTVESINSGKLKVDYMPLPGSSTPCSVSTAPVPCFTIKTDALKKDFPCAVALIINNLGGVGVYSNLVQAFTTSKRPDLTFNDSSLPWNTVSPLTGANSYELAQTEVDPTSNIGTSFIITLNNNMLRNSSMLLISAATIHETLHAYIQYNIATAVDNAHNHYNDPNNWLDALNYFYLTQNLPPNYRDHYAMLTDYFNKAVTILSELDNNAHTSKEYTMAMLYGLNTVDVNCSTGRRDSLNTEFGKILTANNITQADLNTFNLAQLNGTNASQKLPTTGCTP